MPPPSFAADVLEGLRRPRKAIPSRWLYDARGSRLFQEIMALPGYYPTRVEDEILERHAPGITAPLAGGACSVVDLGAGDGSKTRILLASLVRRPAWGEIPGAAKGAVFLLSLVWCASLMPVESLPGMMTM